MTKNALAAHLADLEATLATVRLDLASEAGVFDTSDLPMIIVSLIASLERHVTDIAGS